MRKLLLVARKLFDEAEVQGIHLTDLDIGGGFPVPDADGLSVDLAAMMELINRQIDRLFPDTNVWIEPGRYICCTAVNLVTSVIGTKIAMANPGIFLMKGFMVVSRVLCMTIGLIRCTALARVLRYHRCLAAPAVMALMCCTAILRKRHHSQIGDRLLVTEMGAYTNVSATRFNGFCLAPTIIFENQPEYAARHQEAADEKDTEAVI